MAKIQGLSGTFEKNEEPNWMCALQAAAAAVEVVAAMAAAAEGEADAADAVVVVATAAAAAVVVAAWRDECSTTLFTKHVRPEQLTTIRIRYLSHRC